MKYAKKFKLVPYNTETHGIISNTFPDEKVKINNQALSKIKD